MSRIPSFSSHTLLTLLATGSLVGLTACETIVHQTSSTTSTTSAGGSGGTGGMPADTTASTSDVSSSASTGSGIGEPSDVYPAPHPAAPTVVDFGGKVLTTPKIVPIYFSNDTPAMKAAIVDFTNSVGATDYWKAATSEYGVGAATGLPAIEIAGNAPTSLTDAQIQSFLAAQLQSNPAFPQPDNQTLYAVYYPTGTKISLQGDTSCSAFGGYHAEFNFANIAVPYAVMPRCNYPGETEIDTLTSTASHEYIEAATDPFPYKDAALAQTDVQHIYWLFALGGGETADMCAQNPNAFVKFPGFDYKVQRSWSNVAAKASHDPCQPALPGHVYFNAAPVFKDMVNLGQNIGKVKGALIPVGQSKTVDVALFSDGPTNGNFHVAAYDSSDFFGGAKELDLSFDETAGQNGQTLHLTINVLKSNTYKTEIFFLIASKGADQNLWIGVVGQQ